MRAGLTAVAELTPSDLQAWAELAESAAEPNPFLHPDFVTAAAAAMRPRGLALLRSEDSGGWAACLPVVPVRLRRDIVGAGLAVWRHDYCYLGTPLVAPGAGPEAVGALLGAVRGGFLALDWVRAGATAEALEAVSASPVVAESFDRAFTRSEACAPRRMSSRRAKRLRDLGKVLGGPPGLAHRGGDAHSVEQFLALEASGWKGREGTAMASRPGHGAFFAAVCERFARRDALQMLSLEACGRPAAMQCNLRAGRGLFGFKVAYDDELRRFSPGVQLELDMLDLLGADARADWMDSCSAPDAALKDTEWPERTWLHTLIVPAGGPLGASVRPAVAAMRVARRARRRLRRSRPRAAAGAS